MKVNVELDCTPEEARRFLGLPDVKPANDLYVEALTKAMKGVGSLEQLEEYTRRIAPMGQMGMQLFQKLFESGAAMGGMGGSKKKAAD